MTEQWNLESAHNYENDDIQKWGIHRGSNVLRMKVFFSVIDTEENSDYVKIRDKNGELIDQYSGFQTAVVSKWVTGNSMIIILNSDNNGNTDYGFRIIYITYEISSIKETPHNYEPDEVYYDNVKKPYASEIKITFSRIDLGSGDVLRIYDYNGALKQTYTDMHETDYSTEYIDGPSIKIKLVTDSSVEDWGYKISGIMTRVDDDGRFESSILGIGEYDYKNDVDVSHANIVAYRLEHYYSFNTVKNERDYDVLRHDYTYDGDDGDLIFTTGHGRPGKICLHDYDFYFEPESHRKVKSHHLDDFDVGEDDCEWIIIYSCQVLSDTNNNNAKWVSDGMHMALGYRGNARVSKARRVTSQFINMTGNRSTLFRAWRASNWDNLQFYVSITLHKANRHDHLWGYGTVYPDCQAENDVNTRDIIYERYH